MTSTVDEVVFDDSNSNKHYVIDSAALEFGTKWSKDSQRYVHSRLQRPPSINAVVLSIRRQRQILAHLDATSRRRDRGAKTDLNQVSIRQFFQSYGTVASFSVTYESIYLRFR